MDSPRDPLRGPSASGRGPRPRRPCSSLQLTRVSALCGRLAEMIRSTAISPPRSLGRHLWLVDLDGRGSCAPSRHRPEACLRLGSGSFRPFLRSSEDSQVARSARPNSQRPPAASPRCAATVDLSRATLAGKLSTLGYSSLRFVDQRMSAQDAKVLSSYSHQLVIKS